MGDHVRALHRLRVGPGEIVEGDDRSLALVLHGEQPSSCGERLLVREASARLLAGDVLTEGDRLFPNCLSDLLRAGRDAIWTPHTRDRWGGSRG